MIFISRGFDLFIACLVSSIYVCVCVMVIVHINKTEKPGYLSLTHRFQRSLSLLLFVSEAEGGPSDSTV